MPSFKGAPATRIALVFDRLALSVESCGEQDYDQQLVPFCHFAGRLHKQVDADDPVLTRQSGRARVTTVPQDDVHATLDPVDSLSCSLESQFTPGTPHLG